MIASPFYFGIMRKYVVLVGTLFNDIKITRTDAAGDETALIKVPITYGPKDKMLSRIKEDPNISKQAAIILPMISFEMGKPTYDRDRKLNSVGKVVFRGTTADGLKYQYNPVPYNFNFRVYVYAKNAEDGTKIVEQILPYFTPDWTTTVTLIPEINETRDIPLILNDVSCEDNYDGDFVDRRAIIWTLDLTLKGFLYGPIKEAKIIKFANTTFYVPNGVADGQLSTIVGVTKPAEGVTAQPGLTANGQPTSNIALTVPYTQINEDDDYGFVNQIWNYESDV